MPLRAVSTFWNRSGVSSALRLSALTLSVGVGATIDVPSGESEIVFVRSWVKDSLISPYRLADLINSLNELLVGEYPTFAATSSKGKGFPAFFSQMTCDTFRAVVRESLGK